MRRVVQADRENERRREDGGGERKPIERMPHPTGSDGGPHSREQVVAALDQLFEHQRCAIEEMLHEDDLVVFDDHEPGIGGPRRDHVGEAHPSKLPGEAGAVVPRRAPLGCAHDA